MSSSKCGSVVVAPLWVAMGCSTCAVLAVVGAEEAGTLEMVSAISFSGFGDGVGVGVGVVVVAGVSASTDAAAGVGVLGAGAVV